MAWLSRETGKAYRLLSESEWEYAARAETQTRYWWGDDIGRNRANCNGCGSRWDNERTAPVGSFAANPFGLHDVHGNVREWVQDCWNSDYVDAPSDGRAWEHGNCSSSRRVVRGGAWNYRPEDLLVTRRSTGSRYGDTVGFRVARTLEADDFEYEWPAPRAPGSGSYEWPVVRVIDGATLVVDASADMPPELAMLTVRDNGLGGPIIPPSWDKGGELVSKLLARASGVIINTPRDGDEDCECHVVAAVLVDGLTLAEARLRAQRLDLGLE